MSWPKKPKEIPAVKKVMTPFPYSIEVQDSLQQAREMMSTHRIHHLPVMDQGTPLGIIRYRDLVRTIEQNRDSDESTLRVGAIPLEEAYVVDLSAPLDRVLQQMADQRLGAALVVKDERLAGIFTLTDACRCFAESLRQQFPSSGGNEAA
jgi:acetoin utilization protein AcuB